MRQWNRSYPVLAEEQYIKRHETVCAELHCNISKEIAAQTVWPVETGHEGTVQTDRTVANSKLDSIMCDNGKGIEGTEM
jgi:hypothetical protein